MIFPRDAAASASCTSRTVLGPRVHNTARIASSPSVGRIACLGLGGRPIAIGGLYENYRRGKASRADEVEVAPARARVLRKPVARVVVAPLAHAAGRHVARRAIEAVIRAEVRSVGAGVVAAVGGPAP